MVRGKLAAMRRIERFNLIDKIGRALQERMTYDDIRAYLKSFGIKTNIEGSFGSKWVFAKALLEDVTDAILIQLADELEVPHGHTVATGAVLEESRFWAPRAFRLFLSHLSQHKLKATALKEALRKYGISCFVAHEDINPTLEWQAEIEKALATMDALGAILMPGFNDSKWTDQEIGYALGRGVLVVPLRNGLDPYGFLGKVQGIACQGKTVAHVANAIFLAISGNSATKNKLATSLVDQVIAAPDRALGASLLDALKGIDALPVGHLERLRENLSGNSVLVSDPAFIRRLNAALAERELEPFRRAPVAKSADDEVPF